MNLGVPRTPRPTHCRRIPPHTICYGVGFRAQGVGSNLVLIGKRDIEAWRSNPKTEEHPNLENHQILNPLQGPLKNRRLARFRPCSVSALTRLGLGSW